MTHTALSPKLRPVPAQQRSERKFGEVSEWLKEHAWKVCIRQRIEGSNPSLTAKFRKTDLRVGFFAFRKKQIADKYCSDKNRWTLSPGPRLYEQHHSNSTAQSNRPRHIPFNNGWEMNLFIAASIIRRHSPFFC